MVLLAGASDRAGRASPPGSSGRRAARTGPFGSWPAGPRTRKAAADRRWRVRRRSPDAAREEGDQDGCQLLRHAVAGPCARGRPARHALWPGPGGGRHGPVPAGSLLHHPAVRPSGSPGSEDCHAHPSSRRACPQRVVAAGDLDATKTVGPMTSSERCRYSIAASDRPCSDKSLIRSSATLSSNRTRPVATMALLSSGSHGVGCGIPESRTCSAWARTPAR